MIYLATPDWSPSNVPRTLTRRQRFRWVLPHVALRLTRLHGPTRPFTRLHALADITATSSCHVSPSCVISYAHCHSSRHFLCCSPCEPVSVCSTIDSLCCCSAHSSILKGHSLSWLFLLCSVTSCSPCIFWCWLGKRSHWSQVHH